jgi:hypothetical protein
MCNINEQINICFYSSNNLSSKPPEFVLVFYLLGVYFCSIIVNSWAPRRCPGLCHNFIVKKSRAD